MNYSSNGKILLTSEYLVLDGAKALALPSKFSQSLEINQIEKKNEIKWTSYDYNGEVWFNETFIISENNFSYKGNNKFSDKLVAIFKAIKKLNKSIFTDLGVDFKTRLGFSKDWGLGTSSTLINNLSLWAKINPYDLLDLTFNGSGYDIACCDKFNPIVYQKTKDERIIEDSNFNPSFKENLFFIYLGNKQNTSEAIKNYRSHKSEIKNIIPRINSICSSIIKSNTLTEFEKLILEHEKIISKAINMDSIKNILFKDYQSGAIKSLGAWGGDFILVTGNKQNMEYFAEKGYNEIIPYKDLVY